MSGSLTDFLFPRSSADLLRHNLQEKKTFISANGLSCVSIMFCVCDSTSIIVLVIFISNNSEIFCEKTVPDSGPPGETGGTDSPALSAMLSAVSGDSDDMAPLTASPFPPLGSAGRVIPEWVSEPVRYEVCKIGTLDGQDTRYSMLQKKNETNKLVKRQGVCICL